MMVVKRKYIGPIPINEWIRNPDKRNSQAFVVWKATLDSIKIIEQGLSWQVGNKEKVSVGRDPWVGCNEGFSLSLGIIDHLKARGIYNLSQIKKVGHSTIWHQAWLSEGDLNLEPQWEEE